MGAGPIAVHLRNALSLEREAGRPGAERVLVVVLDPGDFRDVLTTPPALRRERIAQGVTEAVSRGGALGVKHLIAVSSAAVCGAWWARPEISEDDPITTQGDLGWSGDVAHSEAMLEQALDAGGLAGARVTIVRAAPIVGQGVDTLITRHFEVPRLLQLRGSDKRWQFLHIDDLVGAVQVVADEGLVGIVTAGAVRPLGPFAGDPDAETTQTVASIAGRRTVALTQDRAMSIANKLHQAGILAAPASDLAYAVYPWVVRSDTLLRAGWRPRYSTAECVRLMMADYSWRAGMAGGLLRGRSLAAIGAAGAMVALAGTVAATRRTRGVG
ncbi:SDR family oxidoreductase [Rarobacter faecitabidus]|uniref:Nucleoside-diphosphate-sugar epimerase n=1 Tax=Rarobacter faecitabidus TaxID=13243 RepID=A0A542ZUH5_RARFA|nr:NAD-dependent dehydratase [Rarobacter faecitabidus]TQL63949.1 nucleoside-diphosphate-sugar epimerase [Rarobacter faecitabidus]